METSKVSIFPQKNYNIDHSKIPMVRSPLLNYIDNVLKVQIKRISGNVKIRKIKPCCSDEKLSFVKPWSSLVVGAEGCTGPSRKLLCLCQTAKIMQRMCGIIQHMFDCWADPVVHLLIPTKELHGQAHRCLMP